MTKQHEDFIEEAGKYFDAILSEMGTTCEVIFVQTAKVIALKLAEFGAEVMARNIDKNILL